MGRTTVRRRAGGHRRVGPRRMAGRPGTVLDCPGLLFDASVLIQFCATAAGLGYTDIPMAEAMRWTPLLRRYVDQLLEREWGPNTRAGLLQVAAHLALHVDFTGAEGGGGIATLD